MAGKYCLTKDLANAFRQKLKNGEIDPTKLSDMTSEERHTFFKDFLGEDNAKNVNSLFESKLLLKNQKQGMITWAKTVTGIKDTTRRDLIGRINALDKVFNPDQEKLFLKDLASSKLGTDVTIEESKKIFDLAQKSQEAKTLMQKDPANIENRIAYGNTKLDVMDYVNELNPKKANFVVNLLNLPRTLVASLDFVSAPFRHGWGMMTRTNFWKNYSQMPKYAFSESSFKNKMADIISRDTYPLMQDGKLSIFGFSDTLSNREEQFMSNILDKFPITRGSQRAYMGFLNGLRADMFDQFIKSAQLKGEDISKGSRAVKDISDVVNNFTGASRLPAGLDRATPLMNSIFFSPRKMTATVQMLNPMNYLNPKISATARQEALRNILGSVGASAAFLTTAGLAGGKIETDPRSADFGQIRIGNTRIDVTGGNRTYATLLARLMSGSTKSSTTNIVTDLGKGYKATTKADVLLSYIRNKLSPTASFFSDWLYGSDPLGNPFNITQEVLQRILPMNINDGMELFNNDKSNAPMSIMLSLFGVPVQSYSSDTSWASSTSKKLQQFKARVGDDTFIKANEDYNTKLGDQLSTLKEDARYQALTDTQKQKKITQLKKNLMNSVLNQY